MHATLKKNIRLLLEKNSLSIAEAERKAGLKTSAIRNIFSGQSKNPSAQTLQKISKVLGCSIYDLIEESTEIHDEDLQFANSDKGVVKLDLFKASINEIIDLILQKGITTSIAKLMVTAEKVYSYSKENNLESVDKNFARWIVDQEFSE